MKNRTPFLWTRVQHALALFASLFFAAAARAQTGPGNALFIVGDINYVSVPHAAAFNSQPLTVMAWVNTTVTAGQQGLVNKYVAGSQNGWNLFLLNGRVRGWYFVNGTRNVFGGGDGLDAGFIADGRWHHLALVVDAAGGRIFVDGVQRVFQGWTGAPGAATTTQEVRIGSYPGGNNGFVGSIFIDDVSVWNVALNTGQVQNNRNGGTTAVDGSRLALYRSDEGSGTTIADSAPLGGANNGTWVGLVLFSPVIPTVQTLPVSGVNFTEATLSGIVQPNRSAISAGFEWGTTTNFGNVNVVTNFGGPGANLEQNHSLILTGLPSATTFHLRAFASNSATVVRGVNRTFRTFGLFAQTLPASGLSPSSATLNGVANPGGQAAIGWFEFGTTTNLGNVTPVQALGADVLNTNFSHVLTIFATDVTFHFRAMASNSFGLVPGAIQSFSLAPSVATLPASAIGFTNATLHGAASPAGVDLMAWFEWGLTPSYGNVTPPQALGSGGNVTNFQETLTNLFPFGTFHYRAVATNRFGLLFGTNQIFQTPTSITDKVLFGAVTVNIQPPEAVADGASWILDSGAFHVPGLPRTSVTPGGHTVRFGDLANWREPLPIEVFVTGGRTSEVTVVFAPVPSFDFQDVPEQHARPGEAVEFLVTNRPPAGLQVTGVPPPAGSLTFDPATGRVTYNPAAADRLPFTLTFSSGGTPVATTVITPLQNIPTEEVVINYDRPLPDEESRDYITISETRNAPEVFNNSEVETLTVDVSGKTLIFDAAHSANLHRQYSGRENIRELRLYAERVIIRSPLLLPQTHLTIRARELRFEGGGLIDTTPRSRTGTKPRQVEWADDNVIGFPGSPGHHGGDVNVLVERFHADAALTNRFVLRGGDGGEPGEGRNGIFEGATHLVDTNNLGDFFPGILAASYPTFVLSFQDGTAIETNGGFAITNWNRLMARAGNPTNCGVANNGLVLYSETRDNGALISVCGISNTVARGEPAVPSGIPGAGGRGGTLRSTLDLSAYVSAPGGRAGTNGGNYVGGTLVFPYRYRFTTISTIGGVFTSFPAAPKVPGADGPAPIGTNGAPGSVEFISDPSSWLHSFALRSVVQFAKDAYLNGRIAEARALLAEYRDVLRALQPEIAVDAVTNLSEAEFAETTSLDLLTQEMGSMVNRIDSNLDFFGNPAGWVPMLSFEANLTAFQNEINQSIPILYLAYWLNYSATNFQNSAAASEVAVDKLRDELDRLVQARDAAQSSIPQLKIQAELIRNRIGQVRSRLLFIEQELLARAEQNVDERHKVPLWKKALGALSVAADLVPIGQPTVGRIGTGLELLTRVDPENPVQSALNITNVFETFQKNQDVSICFDRASTNSPPPGSSAEQQAAAKKKTQKDLTACGKFIEAELRQLARVFKGAQVDSKELQAELEKIKAADPVFRAVTTELQALNKQKERFAEDLAAAIQAVATLGGEITGNVLATANMEDRVARLLTALDHNALIHVKEMERRAKDRLLKFQYFTAKAFQYRLLEPFPGNLQLNTLFDRFQAIVAGPNEHLLSPEEFGNLRNLFLEDLANTTDLALTRLNANAPERAQPRTFALTPEELQTLNADGQFTINLQKRGLFPSFHEDIRIVNLRVVSVSAQPVGGPIGQDAVLFLDFNHLGISRLARGGQNFLFRHYQTETVSPIGWSAVFDAKRTNLNNSVLSPSSESLLRALLRQPTDENMLLFSRTAGDADIFIRREAQTDNGIDLALDSLAVEVDYEFAQQGLSQRTLDVTVAEGLQPVITVSQSDVSGRRDGQGDFRRVYPANVVLTLEAPAVYGERPFDHWVINNQARPQGAASATFTLTVGTTAEARYGDSSSTNTPPTIVLPPADLTVAVGATATFNVDVIGSAPLTFRWQKNGTPLTNGGRISGSATGTLTITNALPADVAAYTVVVSNPFGTRTSPAALLSVTAPSVVLLPAGPGLVGFEFPTLVGQSYVIERKFRLEDSLWEPVQVLAGTGGVLQFTRPTDAGASFFRLRVE